MLKKLFILSVVVAVVVGAVPDLRVRAKPYYEPVLDRAGTLLQPLISRMLNPVFRWSTRSEEEHYLVILRNRVNLGEPLPKPREFQNFLSQESNSGRNGRDPWGSAYFLTLRRDSIQVGSPGPDGVRGTDDDILSAVPRQ